MILGVDGRRGWMTGGGWSASSRGCCCVLICGCAGAKGGAGSPVVGLVILEPRAKRVEAASRHRGGSQGRVTGAPSPRNSDTKFSPGRNRGRQDRACGKARRIALERWKGSWAVHKCRATFSKGFSGPRAVQRAAQNDPRGRCTLALSKIQSLGAAVRHALLLIASPRPQQASCLI